MTLHLSALRLISPAGDEKRVITRQELRMQNSHLVLCFVNHLVKIEAPSLRFLVTHFPLLWVEITIKDLLGEERLVELLAFQGRL